MKFTKYNSMEDILKYPDMDRYLKIFYSEYLLSMYPEELNGLPVARIEQVAKTPWGEPFSIVTDQLMDAVNLVLDLFENHTRQAVSLWSEDGESWNLEKESAGGKDKVFLIAPADRKTDGKSSKKSAAAETHKRPAVIICPGGGYEEVCFSGEGTPVMQYMEAKGYCAFILRYRVGRDGVYPAPQEDLSRAIQYVRQHAEEYGADPENIMTLGFSAGGHLCASHAALCEADVKPAKVCLAYPVISFVNAPHEGSARALTGGDEKMRESLSVEKLVTSAYPPTFVWTCADDDCVPPSNAIHMGEALKSAGVRYELHIYPSGGHGCALAFSKEAYDWSRAMTEFFSALPAL